MRNLILLFTMISILSCYESGTREDLLFNDPFVVDEGNLTTISFSVVKERVFEPFRCISCHSWLSSEEQLLGYTGRGGQAGVNPGNPSDSLVFLRMQDGTMPVGGPSVDNNRLRIVEAYINNLTKPTPPPPSTPTPTPDPRDGNDDDDDIIQVSFEELKEELIEPYSCNVCHQWADDEESLLTKIVPSDPGSSAFFLRMEDGSMPLGGPSVDERRLKLAEDYINGLVD